MSATEFSNFCIAPKHHLLVYDFDGKANFPFKTRLCF